MNNLNIENKLLGFITDSPVLVLGLHYILNNNYKSTRNYNTNNSYHTLQHCLNVAYNCLEATEYYKINDKFESDCLVLAALFHDAGHPGIMSKDRPDSENIKVALELLEEFLIQYTDGDDGVFKNYYNTAEKYIKATEYPYTSESEELLVRVIRDADLLELTHNKLLVLCMYFAKEMSISIEQAVINQEKFIDSLKFQTEFGVSKFNESKDIILDNMSKINTIFSM